MFSATVIRIFITLLFFTPLFVACNYDIITDTDDVRTQAEPVSGRGMVTGFVTDMNGNPIQRVSVSVGDNAVHTNDRGYFALFNIPRSDRTIVKFRKRNYLAIDKLFQIEFGESVSLNIVMAFQSDAIIINGESGGSITQEDIEVTLPPLAFAYGNTNIYFTSGLDFAATYIRSNSENYFKFFPGEFLGSANSNENSRSFESLGLLEFKYNLREDYMAPMRNVTPANITVSIPESLQGNPPNNLTTWYYDSTDVRWYEEGILTRQDDNYVGTTSHFTYLTWGNYFDESFLSGSAVDINGNLITNGSVSATGLNYSGNSSGVLDENGNFILKVKSQSNVVLKLYSNGGESGPIELNSTPSQGQTQDLGAVTFNITAAYVTLQWGRYPEDLDAHLIVPAALSGEGPFHVTFAERGDLSSYPNACLRNDDTESYGPEMIDFSHLLPGIYTYFVHNVSGENPGPFTYSDAIVNLEIGNEIYVFNIPEENPRAFNSWHVFDLDVDESGNCQVILRNQLIDKETILSDNSMNKFSASPK